MKKTHGKRIALLALILLLAGILAGCGKQDGTAGSPELSAGAGGATGTGEIYLAGPFFNETELANIEYAEQVLEEKGYSYFSPMRHDAGITSEKGTPEWSREVFEMDRDAIDQARVVVALYYGSTSDSGTAWECGYAAARGIPVVLVHVNEDGDSNLMMHCGAATNIGLDELAEYDLDSLPVHEYEGTTF